MRESHQALERPDSDERLFLRIVESGSLKAAAEQIGADPSAVSRRLAALEARLGHELVRRSTRGSTPTDVGRRYYEGLSPLIEQQDALESSIANETDEPRGILRVTAAPEFGVRFVVPVLEQIQGRHPDLAVQLALGSSFYDLEAAGLDAAIRIGRLPDSSLVVRRLARVPRVLVAAPSYIERRGRPATVAALAAHRFLGYRTTDGTAHLQMRSPEGQSREVTVRSNFTVDSISTLVRLTEAGRGLCYGPLWAFANGLDSGHLERLLPKHQLDAPPVQALFPSRRYLPAKTRAFVDAMAVSLAAAPTLDPV